MGAGRYNVCNFLRTKACCSTGKSEFLLSPRLQAILGLLLVLEGLWLLQ